MNNSTKLTRNEFYQLYGKRFVDVVLSIVVGTLLSPLLILILIGAAVSNNGEVFFLQERPGKDGKPFRIIKLKTMRDSRDNYGQMLSDEERLTTFGRIARTLSLDELFQVLNIIKGDMSFIGPRPLLTQYLPLYSPYEIRRHEVLPGISGLAQVKGRNAISWKRRFRYDVFYVDHVSLLLDLRLCFLTLKKVFEADGINPRGMTIAESTFRGHEKRPPEQDS